jgi:predicted MPP superfamily phosphohydrolase
MRHIHSTVIFLSIILLVCFALNFYVLWRLYDLFAIKKGPVFWILVFTCAISLIGGSILQHSVDNIISKIIYMAATNWYGILWLLFSTLIVYEILKLFLKINPSAAGVGIITIVVLAAIYSMINAQLIYVKKLTIPGNTDRNIVQISDIHLGSVSGNFLKRVIEKTNALNPDLVLITGDIADNFNKSTQEALAALRNLKGPVFFVTGNHEMYTGPDRVTKLLTELNVKVLRNQLIDYDGIQIIGIDNGTNGKILEQIFQGLNVDKSKFCILMSHRPIGLIPSRAGVNLTLSGHTHAGQIFPFNYVVRLFIKYMSGLYKHNNSYLYVTSGTGTWGPRMRLGSRSEIVLLKIRKIPDKTGG